MFLLRKLSNGYHHRRTCFSRAGTENFCRFFSIKNNEKLKSCLLRYSLTTRLQKYAIKIPTHALTQPSIQQQITKWSQLAYCVGCTKLGYCQFRNEPHNLVAPGKLPLGRGNDREDTMEERYGKKEAKKCIINGMRRAKYGCYIDSVVWSWRDGKRQLASETKSGRAHCLLSRFVFICQIIWHIRAPFRRGRKKGIDPHSSKSLAVRQSKVGYDEETAL